MNRRKFLLGCISTPIAAKVDAVSAALRPTAEIVPFNLMPGAVNYVDISALQQKIIETLCIPNELLDQPPLDSRRGPWHDGKAGRDQIG